MFPSLSRYVFITCVSLCLASGLTSLYHVFICIPFPAFALCFQLGLDNETCMCDYPLIELIDLVLYLNGSDSEIEEIEEKFWSFRPAPSEACHILPSQPMSSTPAALKSSLPAAS